MRLSNRLYRIACEAREDVEELAHLMGRPRRYLAGFCAIASRHFRHLAHDPAVEFVHGRYVGVPGEHCWNVVRGEVVDLTHTQFEIEGRELATGEPVYVGPNRLPYRETLRGAPAIRRTSLWKGPESYARARVFLAYAARRRLETTQGKR